MAEQKASKGKGKKIGRNSEKCKRYSSKGKKFIASKEHRGCGPLGYLHRIQGRGHALHTIVRADLFPLMVEIPVRTRKH